MKRKLPGRGRAVREKGNWAEPYKSMALLTYNALILAQHSGSWLLSRLQGMLPRQCPSLEGSFCLQAQYSKESHSRRVLLAEAAAAAGLRAAHAWVVWTVSVLGETRKEG